MIAFIDKYQTLIGAFAGSLLAVLSSVFLYLIKDSYEKEKLIKNNGNEIESIFYMAGRDSYEAVRDMKHVLPNIRAGMTKMVKENDLLFFTPPKLNKVFISEERLTILKQGLSFIAQQQIDIAISAVKKFNGYINQFESMPAYIFDTNIKLINLYPHTKEEAVKMYKENVDEYLNYFENIMKTHIESAQRDMLKPVVINGDKNLLKELNKLKVSEADKVLNTMAMLVLDAIKKDLN